MDEDTSAPTITDADTTIEDNSVTVIVEPPAPEPEPESEPEVTALDTVLAMITAMRDDITALQGAVTSLNTRLDNAESAQETDSEFSDAIESATAEPTESDDTGPTSSHVWFKSIF